MMRRTTTTWAQATSTRRPSRVPTAMWGLAALLLALLVHAATGPALRAEEPRPARATIELPEITEAGTLPAGALHVRLSADGVLTLGDDPTPLGAKSLRSALAAAAEPASGRDASPTHLVLEADRKVPWAASTWVLQVASSPGLAIRRTWFAVTVPGGARGAVATFLPGDGSLGSPRSEPSTVIRRKVKLLSRAEGVAPTLDALYAKLTDEPASKRAMTIVELVAPPPSGSRVSTGFVLGVVDAVLRAGSGGIVFEGSAGAPGIEEPSGFAAAVRALRDDNVVPVVRVDRDPALGPERVAGAATMGIVGLQDGPVGSDFGELGLRTPGLLDAYVDEKVDPVEEAPPGGR